MPFLNAQEQTVAVLCSAKRLKAKGIVSPKSEVFRFASVVLCFAVGRLPLLSAAPTSPTDLRIEDRTAPSSIDQKNPRLSWKIETDARGYIQSAYRVLVASSQESLADNKGDLWDSGKVTSSKQVGIPYAGASLLSTTRYFWKVQVFDQAGTTMGWSHPKRLKRLP